MAAVAVVLSLHHRSAGDAPAPPDAHRQPLCHHEGKSVPGPRAAAGEVALGSGGVVVVAWLTVTIGVPLIGVALRAFISNWGVGVSLWDELSLADVP
ncbi:Ferric iron ABC transporter [Klebsiella michiganensis]|uniref:Ferric iron ABC transporter n=1 Tax=Klebsiella michiganensis TaxID=1134687 RepID=A0A7H4PLF9_9ENTR|nr:Ferric iron ABC transporter [Klebsiella michiganensis]